MTALDSKTTMGPQARRKTALTDLRAEAGYRSAKDFAAAIGVIVGRDPKPEPENHDLNAFYAKLSEGSQRLLDELTQWLDFRERVLATEGR